MSGAEGGHAGISWAKTVAERLDLPLAHVRGEAREVGGPLVECVPVRALTSYPQVLASAQEAGLGQRGRRGRAAALLRRPAVPRLAPGHRGLRRRLIRRLPAGWW
jgi:hypothetical protein